MMSDACRDGFPVSYQRGCGDVGHRMAHDVVTASAAGRSRLPAGELEAVRNQRSAW